MNTITFKTKCTLFITLYLLLYGFCISAFSQAPVVTVQFGNPQYSISTSQYCVDVEFKSDVADVEVFGMNIRFFYDDSVLELIGFSDFQGGYSAVFPDPPQILTSPAGPALLNFDGDAEWVNGAMQLVNTDTTHLLLNALTWTKLFQVCFDIDATNPDPQSFCPSIVWDMEQNPENGGYMGGDDGVVITAVDPDPLMDSYAVDENVSQFNWIYIGEGSAPWGVPVQSSCIPLVPLAIESPADIAIEFTESINPSSTGYPSTTGSCIEELTITYGDSLFTGNCVHENYINRRWVATNACDQSDTSMQMITLYDSTPPVLTCPPNVTVECTVNTAPGLYTSPTAVDLGGGATTITFIDDVITEQTSENHYILTRTFMASDICGNTTMGEQIITVADVSAPEIVVPANSILNDLVSAGYSMVYLSQPEFISALNDLNANDITVADNCNHEIQPALAVAVTNAANCATDGYKERRVYTLSASDDSGNDSFITFTVDIMDDMAPVLNGIPEGTKVFCDELPSPPEIIAEDASLPVSILYTQAIEAGYEQGSFNVYREWIATDACGNVTQVGQTIFWEPNAILTAEIVPPQEVICNAQKVLISSLVTGDLTDVTYTWEVSGGESYIQAGQGTPEIYIYVDKVETTVSLSMTDPHGCTTARSITLDCTLENSKMVGKTGTADPVVMNQPIGTSVSDSPQEKGMEMTDLKAWPNPANEMLNISVDAKDGDQIQFTLTDFIGRIHLNVTENVIPGSNNYRIDVSHMPEGTYLLQTRSGTSAIKAKVVVLLRG